MNNISTYDRWPNTSIVYRRFNPPSIDNPLNGHPPRFNIFSKPPAFVKTFPTISPCEIPNKHKNNFCGKVISSFLDG